MFKYQSFRNCLACTVRCRFVSTTAIPLMKSVLSAVEGWEIFASSALWLQIPNFLPTLFTSGKLTHRSYSPAGTEGYCRGEEMEILPFSKTSLIM